MDPTMDGLDWGAAQIHLPAHRVVSRWHCFGLLLAFAKPRRTSRHAKSCPPDRANAVGSPHTKVTSFAYFLRRKSDPRDHAVRLNAEPPQNIICYLSLAASACVRSPAACAEYREALESLWGRLPRDCSHRTGR